MTALRSYHHREPGEGRGPEVTSSDLTDLGKSARFCSGQELSLQATDAGWVIKVFSCYGEGPQDDITILIPKDGRIPVKVLKDQFGKIAHIHENTQ